MVKRNANDFAKDIIDTSVTSKIVKTLNIEILENIIVKARVILVNKSFIDIYYNYDNGKTSFALIKEDKRILGVDNLDFWHVHPFENSHEHKKSSEISFAEFLKMVEDNFDK